MAGEGAGGLTAEDVAYVAGLARLDLGPEEIDRFAGQLSAVLEHVEAIRRLDLAGLAPTAHPLALENVLRDDERRPGLSRDDVLAGAPEAENGCFVVPRILGEAP